MKLSNILLSIAYAHDSEQHVDIHNDIKLHPCQAEYLEKQGLNVTSLVEIVDSEDLGQCQGAKAASSSPKWDQNFSESENKYLVAYYFDSDHSEHEKTNIRNRFDMFAEETCVKMVETDPADATFAHKLQVQKAVGCWSYVGKWWAEQPLSLGSGCDTSTTPQHEVRITV